jgi:histidinol dehydrogenase
MQPSVYTNPPREQWPALLQRPAISSESLDSAVRAILADVQNRGDAAVLHYTRMFDGVQVQDLLVNDAEYENAGAEISDELKAAITLAAGNIRAFHSAQREQPSEVRITDGVTCWRKPVAIEKVGLYIPGGTAPLFSTLLMLGIPAKLAGCREIVVCTPPGKDGKIHPAILYAAQSTGIRTVFKAGGVQAVAAMAFGTATIPQVYKIFGPGNQYVTCAKQLLSREGVAIDLPAGPSELAVYADAGANPAFVAADLLSQAEHGADSQVLLVTTAPETVPAVMDALQQQLEALPRKAIAEQALANSRFVVMDSITEAFNLLNAYAPEHLIIASADARRLSERVINAGSVFLGNYAPESAGDYASGTNHTLPTNGWAKAYSGVSLDSFVKKITFQEITPEGLRNIGPAVEAMAAAEGLQAHKNAVSIRLKAAD